MPPTQVLDPVVKDKEENIDLVDVADTTLKVLEPLDVLADNGSGVSSYSSSDAGSPKAPVSSPLTSSSTVGQHSPSTSDNTFDDIVPLVSINQGQDQPFKFVKLSHYTTPDQSHRRAH